MACTPRSTNDGSTSPGPSLLDPVEPPATQWNFPAPVDDGDDLVAVGADLEPGTVLAAYRSGLFPMPVERQLGWWSPAPRAVLPLDRLRVSRSLRRSCADFEVRIDTVFEEVIDACGAPDRKGRWITPEIRAAYVELHRLGWVHSVEAWSLDDGALAGGLYGVAVGGLFAGESMFHRRRDASKVALVGLVQRLPAHTLLDVQWRTDHLASLGVVEIPRTAYLKQLAEAIRRPTPTLHNSDDSPLRPRGKQQ